jgi:hypothetical protein
MILESNSYGVRICGDVASEYVEVCSEYKRRHGNIARIVSMVREASV